MPDAIATATDAVIKRPVNQQDTERLLRDARTYEPARFVRVGLVERSRLLHDLDVDARELAAILSAGGPKVTAQDVTRWVTEENPQDDTKSELFRRLLTGFVVVGDIHPLSRRVPVGSMLAARGSEDGRKAPRTRARSAGNLSEAVAVAEANGDA